MCGLCTLDIEADILLKCVWSAHIVTLNEKTGFRSLYCQATVVVSILKDTASNIDVQYYSLDVPLIKGGNNFEN